MRKEKLRPCVVDRHKAYFHRWVDHASVVGPELTINGAPAGQLKFTLGIVELEDGTVFEVNPNQIRFTDQEKENV